MPLPARLVREPSPGLIVAEPPANDALDKRIFGTAASPLSRGPSLCCRFRASRTWQDNKPEQQAQILAWIDNSARNWCGDLVFVGNPVLEASGLGWQKSYGPPAAPTGCGIVFWNNAANCAYFMSISDSFVRTTS